MSDYVVGECVQRGLPNVWKMPPDRAVPFIYRVLIDFLCATPFVDPVKVVAIVEAKMREPFVINDDTWGTGQNAEEAINEWERRFPMAAPRGT